MQAEELDADGDRLAEELDPAPIVLDSDHLLPPGRRCWHSNYCRPATLVVGFTTATTTEDRGFTQEVRSGRLCGV